MSRKKNTATAKQVAKTNTPKPLPAAIRTGLWAPWGYGRTADAKKPPKIPVRLGEFNVPSYIGTDAPEHWTDYETAAANLAKVGSPKKDGRTGAVLWEKAGLGRLCESEPELTVLDVDDCIDAKGKVNAAAAELVKRAATYTEISPSGKGLRLALKGGKPEAVRLAEVGTIAGGTRVECYDASSTRYVTFTGNVLPDTKATVAPWSKGFVKWFIDNWKRPAGGAARGSLRLVSEEALANLEHGYADKKEQPVRQFDMTRFLVAKGNGKVELDRSAAFASLFSHLYGDPAIGAGEALAATLATLGDDLADKGTRRVLVIETGEIKRVPFAIADAAKIVANIEERFKVKHLLNETLPKLSTQDRAALTRQVLAEYPQQAWHVAHGALKHGMSLADATAVAGEEAVRSVVVFMQNARERQGRQA